MQLNTPHRNSIHTHEGARAKYITPEQELERSVSSCFLWENSFYESGDTAFDRIVSLCQVVDPYECLRIALHARISAKIRHAPLLILAAVASRRGANLRDMPRWMAQIICRADEMGEFLALYAYVNNTTPDKLKPILTSKIKQGLSLAFQQFDAYQLGKYNRKAAVTLKDVMRLVHPKPTNENQSSTWKQLLDGTLPSPDTWEVALSGGANKRDTFERLLRERKIGYLALLKNLRNMQDAGVDRELVIEAIRARRGAKMVLPFRFIAATRYAPTFEKALNESMLTTIKELPYFSGRTAVVVDVSTSMEYRLSDRSDLHRLDAAAGLASIINGEDVRVFVFNHTIREIPHRQGMGGVDMICDCLGGTTDLGGAIRHVNSVDVHRVICITDEQSDTRVPDPAVDKAYMINVASYKNGVGYGPWTHIDGFSENVIKFIYEQEKLAEHWEIGNEMDKDK